MYHIGTCFTVQDLLRVSPKCENICYDNQALNISDIYVAIYVACMVISLLKGPAIHTLM